MDINYIKQYEDFYKQIGICQSKWQEYNNPHEFALRFLNINETKNNKNHISTLNSVPVSMDILKGLTNA